MDMMQLDINQCPDWYYEPNAYKNTHKCDEQTSYVSIRKCQSTNWKLCLCRILVLSAKRIPCNPTGKKTSGRGKTKAKQKRQV